MAAWVGKRRQMSGRAQIRMLNDGRRVHMQDGPIDLILEAFGSHSNVALAYRAAASRFVTVLDELCGELAVLRQQAREDAPLPAGSMARHMFEAVRPYAARQFITPMAAVAGAVAEEILRAMTSAAPISRAYVNDGGDIALYLTSGQAFVVGMVEYPDTGANLAYRTPPNGRHFVSPLFGSTTIRFEQPIRGIATSGWRGRSFSLGIADAVTVLADTASMADAAATIVANAVDLPGHPGIGRARACDLAPDSDLGERWVTQSVSGLSATEIREALEGGVREAESLSAAGLIRAAALTLQGTVRVVGAVDSSLIDASSMRGSFVHA